MIKNDDQNNITVIIKWPKMIKNDDHQIWHNDQNEENLVTFGQQLQVPHSVQDAATGRNLRKANGSHILSLLAQPGARGIATEKEALKGFLKWRCPNSWMVLSWKIMENRNKMIEGSLEVKLPKISEVGRVREEKRRRDKIKERKETEERRCRCVKR